MAAARRSADVKPEGVTDRKGCYAIAAFDHRRHGSTGLRETPDRLHLFKLLFRYRCKWGDEYLTLKKSAVFLSNPPSKGR